VRGAVFSIRSGKLSFHDLKSQGKVREFNYRRPVGTVFYVHLLFVLRVRFYNEINELMAVEKSAECSEWCLQTLKVARKICETSRPVVALGKRFFYRQIEMTRDNAYR